MSKSSGSRLALVFAVVGITGVGALAFYVKSYPPAAHVSEIERKPSVTTPQVEVKPVEKPNKQEDQPTVLMPTRAGDEITLTTGKSVPPNANPHQFAGEAVVSLLKLEGVRLMSVEVRDHVAILNFNQALAKGIGSAEESVFAHALQVTYGQFKDLDSVLVQVEGQPLESGHFDYSEPLAVKRGATTEPEKPTAP